jgi:hypothetical protein
MHFATMTKWMESAKLTYACSANYFDFIEAVNLTAEQQTFLAEIHDPMFKQTVRDFMVNQQFRKDYWVKGARKITPLEQAKELRTQRFVMTAYRPDVSLKVMGALGEATLSEAVYTPILDLMADHKVRSLEQIEQVVTPMGVAFAQLIQAILLLCGNGTVTAIQDDAAIQKAKKHTDKLNVHLMMKARSNNEISFLVSPLTGGGIAVNRFQQLFVLALHQGKKKPVEWADYVSQILKLQQQKIITNGKPVESDEEQLAEITSQANQFAIMQLPILKALQIA